MKRRCRNEVEQLHMFFQDWFTGAVEDEDDNFARVSAVLADDFFLVSPRGQTHRKADILALIRALRAGRDPGFRIWVEDFELRQQAGDLAVATYRELQEIDGSTTDRLSTVVFRRAPATPNQVEWVHLHETWLPHDK